LRSRASRPVLQGTHGALILGDDIALAARFARLLERVCEIYWRASSIGAPRILDEPEQAAAITRYRGYGSPKPVT
jgi:L-fuculose-phosphate aldolase